MRVVPNQVPLPSARAPVRGATNLSARLPYFVQQLTGASVGKPSNSRPPFFITHRVRAMASTSPQGDRASPYLPMPLCSKDEYCKGVEV
jgi:hypothetical protein